MQKKFCIVIVNWNGWRHTIECLESLLRVKADLLRVVVCDSASIDNSINFIRDWASGKIAASTGGPAWRLLPAERCLNPVVVDKFDVADIDRHAKKSMQLLIIGLQKNNGYAAGCNAGIKYALESLNAELIWLLNNDTVVLPEALKTFVSHFEDNPGLGLCGGPLFEYYRPDCVQALGGGFDPITTRVWHIGRGKQAHHMPTTAQIRAEFYHPIGASMVVSSEFVREIGLMDENYFLYFEELDWVERGRSRFAIDFCPSATVFHKEGAAIGSASTGRKSVLSAYFLVYNKLLFLQRFHPDRKNGAYRRFARQILRHVWRLEFDLAASMIRAICDFWRGIQATYKIHCLNGY
jgi:GT2 family glycosyltransferase